VPKKQLAFAFSTIHSDERNVRGAADPHTSFFFVYGPQLTWSISPIWSVSLTNQTGPLLSLMTDHR